MKGHILSEKITRVSKSLAFSSRLLICTLSSRQKKKRKKNRKRKKYLSLFFVGLLFSEMRQFQIRTGLEEHEHTLCEKHSLFPGLFSVSLHTVFHQSNLPLEKYFPFYMFYLLSKIKVGWETDMTYSFILLM